VAVDKAYKNLLVEYYDHSLRTKMAFVVVVVEQQQHQQPKCHRRQRCQMDNVMKSRTTAAAASSSFSAWWFLAVWSCSSLATAAASTTAANSLCQHHHHPPPQYSPRYVRIIDGGSTGSRLHTFEYLPSDSEEQEDDRIATIGTSSHVDTPLSDYVRASPGQVKDHLLPLFLTQDGNDHDNGKNVLDEDIVIPVYYGATAGMRLVEPHWQTTLYDKVLHSLNEDASFARGNVMIDVFTLSGEDEAYYGALAANYLAGTSSTSSSSSSRLLGALDIGGASTQLVTPLSDDSIAKENFFCTSLLGYGVDQFQKRLFATTTPPNTTSLTTDTDTNPCLNAGYLPTALGNATACAEWMRPLLSDVTERIAVDISADREYWAMSLFFFSFDALRHFTADSILQTAWPTPTLSQLQHAGEILCRMTWEELRRPQYPSHPFTRNEYDLSKRCFEAVYLVELLRSMKFTDDHTIRYMFKTESGDEVEWTLGLAMALRQQRDATTETCPAPQDEEEENRSDETVMATNHQHVPNQDEKECMNRTFESNNNDHNNNVTTSSWTRFLSNVLLADDIFSR
jgi:GDA1/CD39 (nucleoside phosphatase) family